MAAAKKKSRPNSRLKGISANHHRVPAAKWRKLCPLSRQALNETYDLIRLTQNILLHPKTALVTARRWKTTAWNIAWLVADNLEESLRNYEE